MNIYCTLVCEKHHQCYTTGAVNILKCSHSSLKTANTQSGIKHYKANNRTVNHEAEGERMKQGSTAAPCFYLRLPRVILGSAAAKQRTPSHLVQGDQSEEGNYLK